MKDNSQRNKGCSLAIAIIIAIAIFVVSFACNPDNAAALGGLLLLAGGIIGGYLVYSGIKSTSSSGWIWLGALLVGLFIFGIAMALSENSDITTPIGLFVGCIACIGLGIYIYQTID